MESFVRRESLCASRRCRAPQMQPGHLLLRVLACGVCRTDLHIVEGDLPQLKKRLIPGHQIVGEVVDGATAEMPVGTRVGVSWMGGVDGDCWFCKHAMENLCDHPTFTVATRLTEGTRSMRRCGRTLRIRCRRGSIRCMWRRCCARGLSGFAACALRVFEPGERVGLFGFGSSAALAIRVLAVVEMRSVCGDARRGASQDGGVAGGDVGGGGR